jgi:hypothetical protein
MSKTCANCKHCFFADPMMCELTGEEIEYYKPACNKFEER